MTYLHFDDYLECEYENIGNSEFYEDKGGQTCHISAILDEYKRLIDDDEFTL
jgi:hypothetical protein